MGDGFLFITFILCLLSDVSSQHVTLHLGELPQLMRTRSDVLEALGAQVIKEAEVSVGEPRLR